LGSKADQGVADARALAVQFGIDVQGGAFMPTVRDILCRKGDEVATIDRRRPVVDAAQIMNARRIGSLVVLDDREVIGIFTERDILVRVVAARRDPEVTEVGDVMTAPVVCCTPDAELQECKAVVTNQRLRHIPVVEEGRLVGIVTSGDILAREAFEREETIESLTEYIIGPGGHASNLV
jgi:CBS domain-containing protein